jgi:hypothetical protein
MAITPLPPAPLPSDTPSEFNAKAFDLVAALEDFVTETNATAVAVDADATSADADAATATTQAGIATTQAGIATTAAEDAEESATEAAELVENYQGALASDPSLNKDGGALQAGDWYVNTSTGLIRAYTGSVWVTSVNVTAGVSTFSAGSTGLTPSTGTQGDITLSGTLAVSNGGTGLTSAGTAGNILVSNGSTFSSVAPTPGVSIGTLQYFSGTTSPDSTWLYCSGNVFAKSTYTALSAAIGNIPTTFTASGGSISTGGWLVQLSSPVAFSGTSYNFFAQEDFCGSLRSTGYTSTNGINWSTTTAPGLGSQDLIYENSIFVAITTNRFGGGSTNNLYTSTNFSTWTTRTVTTSTMRTVRYLNNLYVVGGDTGFLATSTNAITWTTRTSGTTSTIFAVTYGNGLYVYAGQSGMIATSTDAITWTSRTSGTTTEINNLAYGNNVFVATGNSYNATSTDGITWQTRNIRNFTAENKLVYGYGNLFWGVSSNLIVYSSNGVFWETYTTQTAKNLGTSTNRVIYINDSSATHLSYLYNPFSYDTTTQFSLPRQATTLTTQNGITVDKLNSLYIKATA